MAVLAIRLNVHSLNVLKIKIGHSTLATAGRNRLPTEARKNKWGTSLQNPFGNSRLTQTDPVLHKAVVLHAIMFLLEQMDRPVYGFRGHRTDARCPVD